MESFIGLYEFHENNTIQFDQRALPLYGRIYDLLGWALGLGSLTIFEQLPKGELAMS